MVDTLKSFEAKIGALIGKLDDDAMAAIATKVGVAAKKDAAIEVDAALGGLGFSGWPKAPLTTGFEPGDPGAITFGAKGRGRGAWSVAEFGRHPGMAGPMQGPTLTKTGKVSRARRKRWNGTTQGKGVWSATVARVDDETPGRVNAEVERALREVLKG